MISQVSTTYDWVAIYMMGFPVAYVLFLVYWFIREGTDEDELVIYGAMWALLTALIWPAFIPSMMIAIAIRSIMKRRERDKWRKISEV